MYHSKHSVTLCGEPYALHGLLVKGEACNIYRGERNSPLTEFVTIKQIRDETDADFLVREWHTLTRLNTSEAKGFDYFRRLLPEPIAIGPLEGLPGGTRKAIATRWKTGFIHTLADVKKEYPDYVHVKTAVWMWKRMLELIGFVHTSGYVHGGILPHHVLIHPRDHGATFAGWSRAARPNTPLNVASNGFEEFYPRNLLHDTDGVSKFDDLIMLSRCVYYILGGDLKKRTLPDNVPQPIAELLNLAISDDPLSNAAWVLLEEVKRVAFSVYGEPSYHPFRMKGWP